MSLIPSFGVAGGIAVPAEETYTFNDGQIPDGFTGFAEFWDLSLANSGTQLTITGYESDVGESDAYARIRYTLTENPYGGSFVSVGTNPDSGTFTNTDTYLQWLVDGGDTANVILDNLVVTYASSP